MSEEAVTKMRHKAIKKVALLFGIAVALMGCDSGPHQATESDRFNVYFYYPNGSPSQEVYLGEVTGISACQRTAGSFATSKNMTRASGWSYICCRIAKGSSCYDKHK